VFNRFQLKIIRDERRLLRHTYTLQKTLARIL
jgi:hypothetical protein